MRMLLPAACSILLSTSCLAIEAGQAAPEFTLPNLHDAEVSLSEHRGKIVYVDFWASWCASCKQSLAWMKGLNSRFGTHNLSVIAVNLDDDRASALKMIEGLQPDYEVVFDATGRTPEDYKVEVMPSSLLIDREGRIVKVFRGFRESSKQEVEENLRTLLSH
ncbi:MAG: redoxin [Proteobacteria bacterium]|nr:MAG: redoxin [Pseudomonadota bacterium]